MPLPVTSEDLNPALPNHTAALSTDDLAKGYFAEEGMLAYVKGVQRREIRRMNATVAGRQVGAEARVKRPHGMDDINGKTRGQRSQIGMIALRPRAQFPHLTQYCHATAAGLRR